MITAKLSDYRQSPRKVRLIANLIKGKKALEARDILKFAVKRASSPIAILLDSAIANAKNNFGLDADNLVVKEVRVDVGAVLKRRMPRARGMAFAIKKRTSHVILSLDTKAPTKKELKKAQSVKIEAPKVKAVKKAKAEKK